MVRSSQLRHRNFSGKIPELTIVNLKDSSDKVVSDGVGASFRWFADSKRILVFQMEDIDKQNNWSGHVVDLDLTTGKAKRLASLITRNTVCLDLSPDNQRVLFTGMTAGGPEEKLTLKDEGMKLYEVKLADGSLRTVDNPVSAAFVRYSPSGKKILMYGGTKIAVADADGKQPVVVADDTIELAGLDLSLPGWVDEQTLYFFTNHAVFGTSAKSQRLVIVKADGSGRKQVQPYFDKEALALGKDLPNKAALSDPKAPWNKPWGSDPAEPRDPQPQRPDAGLQEIVSVHNMAISPDGLRIAAQSSTATGIWDLKTGKFLAPLDGAYAELFAFTADGKLLVGMDTVKNKIRVWDGTTGKEVRHAMLPEWKNSVQLAPFLTMSADGKAAYTIIHGNELTRFDPATGNTEKLPNVIEYFRDAVHVPALDVLALAVSSYKGQEIQLHKAGDKEPYLKLALPLMPEKLAFSHDGKTMAVSLNADRLWKQTEDVQLWDTTTWTIRTIIRRVPSRESNYQGALVLSADGKYVAGVLGRSVDLWETTGRHVANVRGTWDTALAFTPDGKTLLVGSRDRRLRMIDTATGTVK